MENQDLNEIVDLVVECAKAVKDAKADGKIEASDLMFLMGPLAKVPAAFDKFGVAFKNLDAEQVKNSAIKILEATAGYEGKSKIFVEKGFSIIMHGVGMYEDIKELKEAV